MELSFREWVELEEAIKFGDIVSQAKEKVRQLLPRSWEELLFRLITAKALPPAIQNRVRGLFNGVYAGKVTTHTLADNPYNPQDIDFYQGWNDGFNSARTGHGLLPGWFTKLFGFRLFQDLFKAHSGEDVA